MEAVTPGDALCEVVADHNCLWSSGLYCGDVYRCMCLYSAVYVTCASILMRLLMNTQAGSYGGLLSTIQHVQQTDM